MSRNRLFTVLISTEISKSSPVAVPRPKPVIEFIARLSVDTSKNLYYAPLNVHRVSEHFSLQVFVVPVIIHRTQSGSHPIKVGEIPNMSVDAKAEIVIERPRSEVAKIMFSPKCDKLWISGLTNVFPLSSGLLKTGSRVNRDGSFHGRQYSAQVLVIKD